MVAEANYDNDPKSQKALSGHCTRTEFRRLNLPAPFVCVEEPFSENGLSPVALPVATVKSSLSMRGPRLMTGVITMRSNVRDVWGTVALHC